GALDADSVALFDHREAFARLVPQLLLALREPVFEHDERAAHSQRSGGRAHRRNDGLAPDPGTFAKGRDCQIDEPGKSYADRDHDELVLERGPGIGPEKGPGNHRQGIETPEAE